MLATMPSSLESPDELAALRELVKRRFGLVFAEENAFLLARRVGDRVRALGLGGVRDYCRFLEGPGGSATAREHELEELFEQLSTRETYFFRERYQLQAFQTGLLPRLARQAARRPIAILSAGCASGEEVYSLAITVLESGLFDGPGAVRIVGVDFSRQALAVARARSYGPSSFRDGFQPPERYFQRLDGGRFEVREEVARLCSFVRQNLAAPEWGDLGGPFDAIFCRNVLIYFDRADRSDRGGESGARAALLRRLAGQLRGDGYLFLGHSESLIGQSSPFTLERLAGEQVYRRQEA